MAQLTKKRHAQLKAEFIELLRSTGRANIDSLLEYLETTDFYKAPARTAHGCAYPGGLLEHSLDVYHILKEMAAPGLGIFGNVFAADPHITSENLIITALLHDLCKIGTFSATSVNRKCYDPEVVAKAPEYSVKSDKDGKFVWESVPGYRIEDDIPLGRGEKSVIMAMDHIRLTKEEIYAIRWHRGYAEPERSSMISDVFAKSPLALALYQADLTATFVTEREKTR